MRPPAWHWLVVFFLPALSVSAAPDVLLLSVDTLRADRLGCYGCPLDTSPNIDRLSRKALLFEDCVCEVPITAPSMGSMLTSLYPRMTGTTRNGLRMPEDVPTVAEQFHAAGYYTFCVQSNWTLKAKLSGLDRGFADYNDDFHKKRWGIIKPERPADEVTDVALDMLEARPQDRPFFAWIHYTDPHAPYKMHKEYNPRGKTAWLAGRVESTRIKYDSEVAFTDAEIGRLLAALGADTTILFVADHGESLHEHDYLGHGRRIYQHGIHVPLMIVAEGVPAGRTTAPVRGIDVAPTLLGLAGLAKVPGMLGLDVLNEAVTADRPRVIETYGGAVPKLPGAKALMEDTAPIYQGVLLRDWKYITDGWRTELYRLDEDPLELEDVSGAAPERVAELGALVEQWDAATTQAEQGEEDLDEDDIEALESLGYLE